MAFSEKCFTRQGDSLALIPGQRFFVLKRGLHDLGARQSFSAEKELSYVSVLTLSNCIIHEVH